MALTSLLVALSLSTLCSSQSSYTSSEASSAASSSSSNAGTVTVTSVSTLAIVILPSSSTSSSATPYSYSSAPSTSYVSSPVTSAPTTTLALQTVPYTGQAMLVGTCDIPQYTTLPFPDGSFLEVPLVGCSNDRPDCCPSLALPANVSKATATNVVSLLNLAPLSICPKDFIDIDPVCCPSGYSLYGQGIIGQTPCYTILSRTLSVPQTVLASISSAVAATVSAQTTTAEVSVIINQVFALGLPCGNDGEGSSSGLSTGAKAGIGVGAAVGGLILIALAIWVCWIARKRRQRKEPQVQGPANTAGPQYSGAPNQEYENKQYPMSPPTMYPAPSGYQGSPQMHPQSFGSHTSWQQPPVAHSGHASVSSDGIHTYGTSTPGSPPGYIPEMPAYQAQARSRRYELPAT